jgi:hypothetical protein
MIGHWRPLEHIPGLLGISITLENLGTMRSRKENAVCALDGALLTFYAPVVDIMPPRHVRALVAHELAHVLQASDGVLKASERPSWLSDEFISGMAANSGTSFEDMKVRAIHEFDQVEQDANTIAKRWGFDIPGMNEWLEKNIDWAKLPDPVY